MRKIVIFVLVVIIVVIISYSFLFGKLFPYSLIVTGFEKKELTNIIVYVEKGSEYCNYEQIDCLIPVVENFHKLAFKRKPRVFLFKSEKTFAQRSISRARFCAFYNGNIVVSPWALVEANEGLISMEIYIKHELSHSLLYQHAGIYHSFRYPKWLLEGIAVYSANQMGTTWYPDKEETFEYIRRGYFFHPKHYKTINEGRAMPAVINKISFLYSEFACIVDYLVESYGMEKFQDYMIQLLNNKNHDAVFFSVFQIDFEEFLVNFKEQVMSGTKTRSPSHSMPCGSACIAKM